jgi:hypothetical protein
VQLQCIAALASVRVLSSNAQTNRIVTSGGIVAAGCIPSLVTAMQTKFTHLDEPWSTRMFLHAWNALHTILLSADAHCETFALLGGIGMLVQVRAAQH